MTAPPTDLRQQLLTRREDLAELCSLSSDARLADLLRQVDEALATAGGGALEACAACGEKVGAEHLHSGAAGTLAPASGRAPGRRETAGLPASICVECLSRGERLALEQDLERAATVQRTLLPPRLRDEDGWQIAWLWEPLGAVSGDYIDLICSDLPGCAVHLLLGDVVGKGVAASLLQSHLHGLFGALAPSGLAVGELVGRANRHFFDATTAASYASLLTLRLDADGSVELANAGHPRPLLAARRGVHPVEGSGFPLGLFPEADWHGRSLEVSAGETLLLYTDGWTEAGQGEEEFGIGRAAASFRRHAHLPLPDLLAACRDDMETFLDGSPRTDDLSLVALRRTGTA